MRACADGDLCSDNPTTYVLLIYMVMVVVHKTTKYIYEAYFYLMNICTCYLEVKKHEKNGFETQY